MPELPELHGMANVINSHSNGRAFVKCTKSSVSKLPRVRVPKGKFFISAESRGKELMMRLQPAENGRPIFILCNMGMTGFFEAAESKRAMHRHAHLRFFATDGTVLSFVDQRRFGTWRSQRTPDWPEDRGPDPVKEYDAFRRNVVATVKSSPENFATKPICEILHDQSLFNGIGNYLRAEILFRSGVPPFMPAKSALAKLPEVMGNECEPDLLTFCRDVPTEVINTSNDSMYRYEGGKEGKTSGAVAETSRWEKWLRVYAQDDASWAVDKSGRRIWFHGPPGKLFAECAQKSHLVKNSTKLRAKTVATDRANSNPTVQIAPDPAGNQRGPIKSTRRILGKRPAGSCSAEQVKRKRA